jgi:hypothetical protein
MLICWQKQTRTSRSAVLHHAYSRPQVAASMSSPVYAVMLSLRHKNQSGHTAGPDRVSCSGAVLGAPTPALCIPRRKVCMLGPAM